MVLNQFDEDLRQRCQLNNMQDHELRNMPIDDFQELIFSTRNQLQMEHDQNIRSICSEDHDHPYQIQEDFNEDEENAESIKSKAISKKTNKKICKKCNGEIVQEGKNKTKRKKQKRKKKPQEEQKSPMKKLCDSISAMIAKIGIINQIIGFVKKICGAGPKIEQEELSYKKLIRMIETYHPTNPETREKFSPSDSVNVYNYGLKLTDACGLIQMLTFCKRTKSAIKKKFKIKGKKQFHRPETMKDLPDTDSSDDALKNDTYRGLSEAAIYLGEGSVLYLQMMKTFAILFCLLSVINMPLFYFLQSSSRNNSFTEIKVVDYFTLGNLGVPENSCYHSYILYDKSKAVYTDKRQAGTLNEPNKFLSEKPLRNYTAKINLQCEYETDYVDSYDKIGFIQALDATNAMFFNVEDQCNLFRDSKYDIVKNFTTPEQKDLYDKLKMDPKMHLEAQNLAVDNDCSGVTMFNSEDDLEKFNDYFSEQCQGKNNCTLDFDQFNIHELISTQCLERIFNDLNLKAEFLLISNCKKDYVYIQSFRFHKETVGLLAIISNFISVCLIYYFFYKLKNLNDEYLEIIDYNVIKMSSFTIQIDNLILDKTMQDMRMLKMKIWLHFQKILDNKGPGSKVVDVQLSISTLPKQMVLWQLQKIRETQSQLQTELKSGRLSYQKMASITNELEKLQEKDKRVAQKWKEYLDKEKFNKPLIHISKYDWIESIDHIWVTFKSTKTPKKIMQAYEPEHPIATCFRSLFCIKNPDKDLVQFGSQQIEILKTVEPDQIIWTNLKYTFDEQRKRGYLVFFISIVAVMMTVLISISAKAGEKNFEGIDCPAELDDFEDILTAQNARMLTKQVKSGIAREQLSITLSESMYCYCAKLTGNGNKFWLASTVKIKVQEIDPNDQTEYCLYFIRDRIVNTIMTQIFGAIIAIINSMIAILFQYLGLFLVKHTTIETQVVSFSYILTLEFINMAFINLIKAFDPTGFMKILSGNKTVYKGFDTKFYRDMGHDLSKTIILSVIITNIQKIKLLCQVLLLRFFDRGCRFSLKKDLEDEDDDEPNSKKKTQAELEELYMGSNYNGEASYSRMMSHLMVLIAYSSGMPILYIVGFLFFTFTFFAEKWNLILILKKTTTLNRVIPNYSSSLLNFIILNHFLLGIFMITNPYVFEVYEDKEDLVELPEFLSPKVDNDEGSEVAKRFQFLHQKFYVLFVVAGIIFHLGGSFVIGLLVIIFDQLKKMFIWIKNKIVLLYKNFQEERARREREKRLELHGIIEEEKKESDQPSSPRKPKIVKRLKQEPIPVFSDDNISVDLDDEESVNLDPRLVRIAPYAFLQLAIKSKPVQEEEEGKQDEQIAKQTIRRVFTQRKVITSGLILIQRLAIGLKKQVLEFMDKRDQYLSDQEIKKQTEIMAKFKLLLLEPNASENIYAEMNIQNLIKFYKRANKDFLEAQQFFNVSQKTKNIVFTPFISKFAKKDKLRIIFEEICYTNRISEVEVKRYLLLLEDRIADIEQVIDDHIEIMREELIHLKRDQLFRKLKKDQNERDKKKKNAPPKTSESTKSQRDQDEDGNSVDKMAAQYQDTMDIIEEKLRQDPALQFDTFTFEKKLASLYEYETELLNADKKQPANRKGTQTICRMTGSISQSYFILDQESYNMASKIWYNEVEAFTNDSNED